MNTGSLDRIRQWANLLLPVAQIAITYLAFYRGTTFERATDSAAGEALITPSGYAFSIWGLIYAGAVAYGIYQFLPSHREYTLLRDIGLATAMAFLGTSCWLIAARFMNVWYTVVCIVWMLGWLLRVFVGFTRDGAATAPGEKYWVVAPMSIFFGWITVAILANTASALKSSGLQNALLPESTWAVIMLLVAALAASVVLFRSHGNPWFAATILWADTAIATRSAAIGSRAVRDAAILVGVLVLLAFVTTRFLSKNPAMSELMP